MNEAFATKQATFLLWQNYPNPFNPETEIRFQLMTSGLVTLAVYDVSGRLVTTLTNSEYPSGNHTVRWKGVDAKGVPVASGIYYYRLKFGEVTRIRKMLLLR